MPLLDSSRLSRWHSGAERRQMGDTAGAVSPEKWEFTPLVPLLRHEHSYLPRLAGEELLRYFIS